MERRISVSGGLSPPGCPWRGARGVIRAEAALSTVSWNCFSSSQIYFFYGGGGGGGGVL